MSDEIIHTALDNLRQATGIQGVWKHKGPLDGTLDLKVNNRKMTFVVEMKTEIRPHQLPQVEKLHQEHENFILIADRIFPRVKEELQQKGIAYIEANGNVFLKDENTFLFVDTHKNKSAVKETGNRAFTKTGLKVLFYLLQHPDYINLTQRDIAENADVALGNIPQVIDGLKETGYLIPLNNRQYVWEKRRELLERWVTEYGTVLKPKLKKERYTYQGNWSDLQFKNTLTVWGGEPAADILTNYLRPEKLVLYTKENRVDLMKNYRMIPRQDGQIEVLEMFWKQDENQPTAPAILVYADLLLEGGKRNKETAEKILNEYIEPML
jgi:hypothetical protein